MTWHIQDLTKEGKRLVPIFEPLQSIKDSCINHFSPSPQVTENCWRPSINLVPSLHINRAISPDLASRKDGVACTGDTGGQLLTEREGKTGLCHLIGPSPIKQTPAHYWNHIIKQYAHSWYVPCCFCCAWRQEFIRFPYNNNVYMEEPGAGVSIPVENRSCQELTHLCGKCVIPLCWCLFVYGGWVMAKWLACCIPQHWVANNVSDVPGLWFTTGMNVMKQFAHNWYLLCCSCTEACIMFPPYNNIHTLCLIMA